MPMLTDKLHIVKYSQIEEILRDAEIGKNLQHIVEIIKKLEEAGTL